MLGNVKIKNYLCTMIEELKNCFKCKEDKPLNEFTFRKDLLKLRNTCKSCINDLKIKRRRERGIIGIYKITSPSGKIYIGQSVNIEERKKSYENLWCEKQSKIYLSIKKYGWDLHVFEIQELLSREELDKREIHWISFYNSVEKGLNLTTGGKYYKASKEKLEKQSIKKGIKHANHGKVASEETKLKMSNAQKGKKKPIGSDRSLCTGKATSVLQYDLSNNFIKEYKSISKAAKDTGVSTSGLVNALRKNQDIYRGYKWKYKE